MPAIEYVRGADVPGPPQLAQANDAAIPAMSDFTDLCRFVISFTICLYQLRNRSFQLSVRAPLCISPYDLLFSLPA
jgi:hypothetical protein